MPRDFLAPFPWCLLAAIIIGCASADDADDEDTNDGTPSSSTASNRPNNGGISGTSGLAPAPTTGSGGAGSGASGVGPSGAAGSSSAAGGRASASGGQPSASAGGRASTPSGGDDDEAGSGNQGGSGGASASGGSSSTPPNSTPDGDVPSFAADILPILRTSCGSCHATGFLPRFAATNADSAYIVAVDLSDDIVARIDAGSMPPACGGNAPGSRGCVSADDFEEIQAWVEGDTPE
jgi:hypothetical protein